MYGYAYGDHPNGEKGDTTMNNFTSFIIDNFGDFRSDLFIKLKKMELTCIPIEEYLRIPTIRLNRDVHRRKIRISKILNKDGLYEHLKVIIGEFPDGERVIINGNTRKQIWIEGLSDKPDFVIAQINHYNNKKEAKKEYYAIDSQSSVENASDKFTGAFNSLNMTLQSKMKGGGINNTIKDFMHIWPDRDIPKHNDISGDFYLKTVELVKNELIKLDSIFYEIESNRTGFQKCMKNGNFKVVFLAFLKKYGIDNQRVIEGIKRLLQGTCMWHGSTRMTDGISHINHELSNDASNWLPKGATRHGTIEQFDFLFNCFQKWMDDTEMAHSRHYNRENSPYLHFFDDQD